MRVQRVASLDADEQSWTVLGDDWRPVMPVEQFLAHLSDQRRSPNTVKAYAHDLKDYFEYLERRSLAWDRLRYDELAAFKPWLRLPAAARRGEISVLPATVSACTEATINRKLAAITSFYEFHRRHGVEMALTIRDASRPVVSTSTSFRPFLAHVKRSRPRRSDLRLREPKRRPATLTEEQVSTLVDACGHLRDQVLLRLLNDTGLRIGEALGLRHEDIRTADGLIDVRCRVNANGARAKTWERSVPVGAGWLRLHADYLHHEYCDLDSDYFFVRLWSKPLGRPLSYPAVTDLFGRLARRTGIAATPHMFRHSYATRLLRAGVKAEVVQKLLGHASVSTTIDTYAHLTIEDVRHDLVTAGFLTGPEPPCDDATT
jgi:integrase/recombinase XerD